MQQSAVFAPLLLNIYLEKLFFILTELTEVYNFAEKQLSRI